MWEGSSAWESTGLKQPYAAAKLMRGIRNPGVVGSNPTLPIAGVA